MSETPLISVVIPAYNAAGYIDACLASVAAQTGPWSLEVIVVDDGSSDDTAGRVAAWEQRLPGLRLLTQANAGPSAARNLGIAAARGELVALLDADDLWAPGKLAAQLPVLARHPQATLVFGDVRQFDAAGPRAQTFFAEMGLDAAFFGDPELVRDAFEKLFRLNYIPTGSVILRKSCLATSGSFEEGLRHVEDLDLWFRIAHDHPIAYTSQLCQEKRNHGANTSADVERMTRAYVRVLLRQACRYRGELPRRGIRLGPRIGLEYCLLGDRALAAGDPREARRWYGRALPHWPSPRPLWYWLRSLAQGRGGTDHGRP